MKHHPGTPCNAEFCQKGRNILLIDGKWGFYFPKILEIELTKKCNLNCIHCWNNSSKQGNELSFELIERELTNSPRGLEVKLTGGEPLLYSKFKKVLELCKRKGHSVEITSNGTQINPKTVQYLGNYIERINISLHGSNKEIHEGITNVEGSYNKAIESIRLLQDQGINPTLNFTVMRKNVEDIKNIMSLGKSLGVRGIRLSVLKNYGRGKNLEGIFAGETKELKKSIILYGLEIGVKLERSELYTKPYNLGFEESDVYGCGGMRIQAFIGSDGNVYPCNLSDEIMGNLRENTLEDIWNGESALRFRKIFICPKDDCSFRKYCAGKCKAK